MIYIYVYIKKKNLILIYYKYTYKCAIQFNKIIKDLSLDYIVRCAVQYLVAVLRPLDVIRLNAFNNIWETIQYSYMTYIK